MTAEYVRVFTLEVDSKPILAFEASAMREASSLLNESWLSEDLTSLKSDDVPPAPNGC
jgi:hypothetical protein